MSESDGMDDVLDGGLRQSLMIASRIAETLARRRQESQRQQEHQDAQAAHEARARLAAERSAAHAALAPVEKDQWWDKAQPSDIATAHAVATGWKDHDPAALAASEKIRQEVLTRYGIDTHDVGTDAAYLESGIQTITTGRPGRTSWPAARKRPQGGRRTREGHGSCSPRPGRRTPRPGRDTGPGNGTPPGACRVPGQPRAGPGTAERPRRQDPHGQWRQPTPP